MQTVAKHLYNLLLHDDDEDTTLKLNIYLEDGFIIHIGDDHTLLYKYGQLIGIYDQFFNTFFGDYEKTGGIILGLKIYRILSFEILN